MPMLPILLDFCVMPQIQNCNYKGSSVQSEYLSLSQSRRAARNWAHFLYVGITIGLGRPFLLIREYGAPISPVLTSLLLYTQGGSFRSMCRELTGQIEEYDFGAVLFSRDKGEMPILSQFMIAAGEPIEDEDFERSLNDALDTAYPQHLTGFSLSTPLNRTKGMGLQYLVELIQT